MKIDRGSLGVRFLAPILALILVITLILLTLVGNVMTRIQEDYRHFMVTAAANHVTSTLDMAAADLTSAKLTGNPFVVEAKKKTVLEAIRLSWSRGKQEGIITDPDGAVLVSTLDPEATQFILAHRIDGVFSLETDKTHVICISNFFPLWGWYVTTIAEESVSNLPRREVTLILPGIAAAIILLALGLYSIFRKNIRQPVSSMISNVNEGRNVDVTGISEFDRIGRAVNEAFQKERDRTEELKIELAERLKAENMLKESEARITLILTSIAEGIFGTDQHGRCTFCNPAALRMLGYERAEAVVGNKIHDLIHCTKRNGTPYYAEECNIHRCYSTGAGCHADDEVFWRSDGSNFPVEYWAQPIMRDGAPAGVVTAFVDITERKKLEEQLRQSQKMEVVGQLAGGIAHDFNNILTAIIGYASIAQMNMSDDDTARLNVDHILDSANRAAALTHSLLAFSRKQILNPRPMDLNELILRVEKLLRRIIGEDIELKTAVKQGELIVNADSGQIEQILMNLAANARDAMPGGGVFTIETDSVVVDEEYIMAHSVSECGTYAVISVSDTGMGMDDATRKHVFEPFFTTKEVGKGTGLGLSIVYGIIQQHNGFVNVYSEPERGTTFKIYLPIVQTPVVKQRVQEVTAPVGGTETVLLAEDDETVRELSRTVLTDYGYTVIVSENGEDAVRMFAEQKDRIQLVILDVVMPKMTGGEVYQEIKKMWPKVKALFLSGYTADAVHIQRLLSEGVDFVRKPIAPTEFLKKVREILDRK
jgi:PAS domain S-box-containing protein